MAITIQNSPSNGESVQDTLWHVVSSNHSSIPDFKYVFDVYVDGVQKIRVKQYPEPGTTYGYFDAGAIVRNSVDYNWLDTSAQYQDIPLSIGYDVRYGEEYSGTTTLNLVSGTTTAFNWRPDLFRRKIEDPINTLNHTFMTERNVVAYADFNESLFIGFNNYSGSAFISYEIFNSNNTQIYSTIDYPTYDFVQINLKSFLNYALSIDGKYVLISGANQTITIYNKCNPKYETIPVHFLNRFGVFETIHFDLVSRLSMDVERKGYERRDFIIDGSSVNYVDVSNKYAESKINYSNKMNWLYRLTADAMNDTDYAWASQLINSHRLSDCSNLC